MKAPGVYFAPTYFGDYLVGAAVAVVEASPSGGPKRHRERKLPTFVPYPVRLPQLVSLQSRASTPPLRASSPHLHLEARQGGRAAVSAVAARAVMHADLSLSSRAHPPAILARTHMLVLTDGKRLRREAEDLALLGIL